MKPEQLAELIAFGHETRGVEFKRPGPRSDKQLFAKVARAVLGMANLRDGGLVVVGVEDKGDSLDPVGISAQDLPTWTHDDVCGALAPYADPCVVLHVAPVCLDNRHFVVIRVDEFQDLPVLCGKEYQGVLREGACYVRRRGKIETSEIPTQTEMRELLDLAVEKGVRRFVQQAHRAGVPVSGATQETDAQKFEDQLKSFG
jgi:predicted HTH transcriptional regulator